MRCSINSSQQRREAKRGDGVGGYGGGGPDVTAVWGYKNLVHDPRPAWSWFHTINEVLEIRNWSFPWISSLGLLG